MIDPVSTQWIETGDIGELGDIEVAVPQVAERGGLGRVPETEDVRVRLGVYVDLDSDAFELIGHELQGIQAELPCRCAVVELEGLAALDQLSVGALGPAGVRQKGEGSGGIGSG